MRGEPEGRTTRRDGARSRQASMATATPRRPSGATPDAAQPRFVVKKNNTPNLFASLQTSKTQAEALAGAFASVGVNPERERLSYRNCSLFIVYCFILTPRRRDAERLRAFGVLSVVEVASPPTTAQALRVSAALREKIPMLRPEELLGREAPSRSLRAPPRLRVSPKAEQKAAATTRTVVSGQ